MGQATGLIYTCETTGHTPAAVLDAHPERRRGTVSGQSAPNPMRCVSSCCQPSLSSPRTGWYASQWQAIGQLYTCTNHHYGAWARRAHEGPCGGYVGLASKPKLQGR